jgi:hypothetical protein
MARKFYFCKEFPTLCIAGVCDFVNHEYNTPSIAIQSKIEQSQSFTSRIVVLLEPEPEAVEEDLQTWDIKPADLGKMRKLELQEVADAMGVEYGPDATRQDIISLLAAELRRE